MDLSLTNKDGKQDAEEDDDEQDEVHSVEPCVECKQPVRNRNFMLRAGSPGYGITKAVSRAPRPLDGFIAVHNNTA